MEKGKGKQNGGKKAEKGAGKGREVKGLHKSFSTGKPTKRANASKKGKKKKGSCRNQGGRTSFFPSAQGERTPSLPNSEETGKMKNGVVENAGGVGGGGGGEGMEKDTGGGDLG